jgi:hypothetical protein
LGCADPAGRVFLFVAAAPKLIGSHSEVQEFGLIGAGQWFRYFV